LAASLLAGDKRALARAISMVEDRLSGAEQVIAEIFPATGRAAVTGITGPPGVGKSTLIHALIRAYREQGRSVATLCVDPSSSVNHGALLGDRVRMSGFHNDADVYIRSMATRGTLGGLAAAARSALLLMDGAGFDELLVETVGVGQSELTVKGAVDTVVLVLMPGAGDAIQFLKAGVMEIPDVIVVNKRDRGGAESFAAELRRATSVASRGSAPLPAILLTDGIAEEGIAELIDAIADHRTYLRDGALRDARRADALSEAVLDLALEEVRERLLRAIAAGGAEELLETVHARRTHPARAARLLLDHALTPNLVQAGRVP
jgi:LAO/AO transport system kinase